MHKNLSGVACPLLGSLSVSGILIFSHNYVLAQVTPDNTLGNESSVVNTRDDTSDSIDGGAIRGQNLFHSFQEFNVDAGRGVYFANPEAVTNIFSRVTGNDVSNILGTLGVDGAANLFLINPNGIIFGEGASLDVNGSFAATTADGIEFGEQGFFSVSNPESPNLLTINPSAYLFNQVAPGAIANNSKEPAGKDLSGIDVFGLRVPNGKSLMLVGGNVSMDGGWAIASGGHIELGGLTEAGSIGIQSDTNNNFSLNFPEGVQRGDIFLTNKAIVGVVGDGGGSIAANARNLEISANSEFFAGIGEGLTAKAKAGDFTIDATDKIELSGTDSLISNSVQPRAVGDAGNIDIKTGSLSVTEGGEIKSSTFAQGDSGNITITADNTIFLDDSSYIVNNVEDIEAVGNAGKIDITTGSLSAINGSQINSFTRGQGNAGDIIIQATEAVTFDGFDSNNNYSSSFSSVEAGGVGNGGDINITARSLSLTNGAELNTSVREALDPLSGGNGNGGDLTINTDNLSLRDRAEISASTFSVGNAGNIVINSTDSVSLDKGNTINSNIEQGAVGNGGQIEINTNTLDLTNGGQVLTIVREARNNLPAGKGNAGNIAINVNDTLTLNGRSEDGQFTSSIYSYLSTGAAGNAGNLKINAGNLVVQDGGEINSSTYGQGNAGNLMVNTKEKLSLDGGRILSTVEAGAVGDGGQVKIDTGNFSVINDGQIETSVRLGYSVLSPGIGNAGDIIINAREDINIDGGFLAIASALEPGAIGKAGDIKITSNSLILTNGVQVLTSTLGQGNGGDIIINARETINLDGTATFEENLIPSLISSGVGNGGKGKAGNINIQAENLFLKDGGAIKSNTLGKNDSDNAGNIDIILTDILEANNGEISTSSTQSSGGAINIRADNINLRGNSDIRSNIFSGTGGSGNIEITADAVIAFDDSDIFAFAADGQGGNITLDTPAYFAENFTLNSLTSNPDFLGNNSRADLNATGAVSGVVSIPDVSFIQNSLNNLPDNSINTDELVANSCVSPVGKRQEGKFIITGTGGLPDRPGNGSISDFATGEVRNVPSNNSGWHRGEPIIEPQGVYRLTNGKLVMSRECHSQ
jgi:filamentous hemagglutinin family protein